MKDTIVFICFIIYATLIFFIQSYILFLVVLFFNILAMILLKVKIVDAIQNIAKLLPFILLTVIVNCILSNYEYAILVAIKLVLVCNVTYIYAKTTTVRKIAITIKGICVPLKWLKVNPDDIELLVCIALSMIPILKKELIQLKESCLAKGIEITVKNMKVILAKLMVSLMKRVNEIEESMIEKGYGEI